MKTKNFLYIVMGFHVLSYNYAIANYLTPSIVMGCVGAGLSMFLAFPSKNDRVQFIVQIFSITLIEVALLYFARIDSSNNSFSFLTGCNVISSACWSIFAYNVSKGKRYVILNFVEKMILIFLFFLFIAMILPQSVVSSFVYADDINNNGRLMMFIIITNLFSPMIISAVYSFLYKTYLHKISHQNKIVENATKIVQ